MKKLISILLVAMLIIGMFPATALTAFAADTVVATFELGANGSASHADGSIKTSYSETDGNYTLTFSGITNMYTGARDAKGNGCIKLGASSKAGGFSFTVPNDVTSVVIYAAKYKANATKLKVGSTTHTLTKNSNDGAYDAITVDTTSTKTVTLTTVSGGYRAMVNTIEFIAAGSSTEPDCEHTNKVAIGEAKDPSCTETGITAGEKCADCGEILEEQKEISAKGHNYVDGACSVCGAEQPAGYALVTNAAELKVGNTVVIVATGYDSALSTTQNSNNRGKTAVVKADGIVTWEGEDVQVLTLEEGTTAGTWAFYTGTGYLCAASSSSNYLRAETTKSANSS